MSTGPRSGWLLGDTGAGTAGRLNLGRKTVIQPLSPGLTMAVISSKDWRNSTILDLWEGSTRAKQRAFWHASLWAAGESSSNSRPVKALTATSSSSPKMPMRRQMATAVPLLSPVIMMTRIPACRHSLMEEATSIRGGSSIPTQPTKVKLV